MDKFIDIDLKDGTGGFLIHDTEGGRGIANELLKDQKYIMSNHKEIIKELAEDIKKKIDGGTLLGDKVDLNDIDCMIVAAYNLAKFERYGAKANG